MSFSSITSNHPTEPLPISSVDFLNEVLMNIKDQILMIESEMISTSSNSAEVKALYDHLHEILHRSEGARVALTAIAANKSASKQLEDNSETVKKLRKLNDAILELEKELRDADFDYFRIVAELLSDAKEQMKDFLPYAALPQIVLLTDRLESSEAELKKQVQWSLREIGQLVDDSDADAMNDARSIEVGNLAQVHLLVEVLGKSFRDDLLERFAQLQLIPYEKLFRSGKKYSEIEHLEKRFVWFKKLLRAVDSALGEVFPASWCMSYHLYREFARRSRAHLSTELTALERSQTDPEAHVAVLLKALKYIYTFETELRATWVAAAKLAGQDEGMIEYDMKESVGDAFDAFLGPYIQIERKNLEELMGKLLRDEESNSAAGAVTKTIDTFDSSREMFVYIKASLKRCTMFSSGQAFLSLSREYRICLQQYADSLKRRCPTSTLSSNGKDQIYEVKGPQEVMMCRIVNTAEYCGDVVPQLESMMKQLIKPHLVDQVDFAPEVDKFMDLIAFATKIIVAGALTRMDPAFQAMRKVNWSNVESVGDDSPYVKDIRLVLNVAIPRVRDHMSATYFKNFCAKMSMGVFDKLQYTVLRLKRVSNAAGGQLLLDLNGVKEIMMKLPWIKFPENGPNKPVMNNSYGMSVKAAASKIEVILKLVCVDDEDIDTVFKDLWPDGSEADLAAVKKIKGMDDPLNPLNIDDPLYNKFRHGLDNGVHNFKDIVVDNPVGQGIRTVGMGVKGAATGIVGGISTVITGGIGGKSSLDRSNHSDESTASHGLSVIADDFKHAFGGMKAFMSSAVDGIQNKNKKK